MDCEIIWCIVVERDRFVVRSSSYIDSTVGDAINCLANGGKSIETVGNCWSAPIWIGAGRGAKPVSIHVGCIRRNFDECGQRLGMGLDAAVAAWCVTRIEKELSGCILNAANICRAACDIGQVSCTAISIQGQDGESGRLRVRIGGI